MDSHDEVVKKLEEDKIITIITILFILLIVVICTIVEVGFVIRFYIASINTNNNKLVLIQFIIFIGFSLLLVIEPVRYYMYLLEFSDMLNKIKRGEVIQEKVLIIDKYKNKAFTWKMRPFTKLVLVVETDNKRKRVCYCTSIVYEFVDIQQRIEIKYVNGFNYIISAKVIQSER